MVPACPAWSRDTRSGSRSFSEASLRPASGPCGGSQAPPCGATSLIAVRVADPRSSRDAMPMAAPKLRANMIFLEGGTADGYCCLGATYP